MTGTLVIDISLAPICFNQTEIFYSGYGLTFVFETIFLHSLVKFGESHPGVKKDLTLFFDSTIKMAHL